ncbi:MAG: FIST N-terminal domain-containing protein [Actinomycetota bacterium]
MDVRQGTSAHPDADAAVAEATTDWPAEPQLLIAFNSSTMDAGALSAALARTFPGSPLVGCTTAGEHLGDRHLSESFAVAGVWDSTVRWQTCAIRGLADFGTDDATAEVDRMLAALGADRETMEPNDYFAMLLIDGLSMQEERVTGLLAEALEGIPLAGGSAGDDLGFDTTYVLTEDGAFSDGAILVLAATGSAQVEILKHQHYVNTSTALCITKADPAQRVVMEIDGYPALEAYAAALGLAPEEVTDDVTFLNPITFSLNGEIYVRSIQSIRDDGALVLYCAIDEGMVLRIGSQRDMATELRERMNRFDTERGRADLIIGFNCILRSLEADRIGQSADLSCILGERADAVIGFDTYGEQHNGLHINQTLVAIAIHDQRVGAAV